MQHGGRVGERLEPARDPANSDATVRRYGASVSDTARAVFCARVPTAPLSVRRILIAPASTVHIVCASELTLCVSKCRGRSRRQRGVAVSTVTTLAALNGTPTRRTTHAGAHHGPGVTTAPPPRACTLRATELSEGGIGVGRSTDRAVAGGFGRAGLITTPALPGHKGSGQSVRVSVAVCGVEVAKGSTRLSTSTMWGARYWCCGSDCPRAFANDPRSFVA